MLASTTNHRISSPATFHNFADMTNEVNEHYIHSRLKSVLSSGPKEVASAYSGITAGNNLRRMASVNAEARTKLVYSPDYGPKTTVHQESQNGLRLKESLLSPTKKSDCDPINSSFEEPLSLTTSVTTTSPVKSPVRKSFSPKSSRLSLPRLMAKGAMLFPPQTSNSGTIHSVSSSVLPTNSATLPPRANSAPSPQIVMKDSVVQIVDVRKTQQRKHMNQAKECTVTSVTPSKRLRHHQLVNDASSGHYVKRVAAINAQAFVHAIILGYEGMTKQKMNRTACASDDDSRPTAEHHVLGKRTSKQPGNSNQNNSKKKKEGTRMIRKVPSLTELAVQTVKATSPDLLLSSLDDYSDIESSSTSNDDHDDSVPAFSRGKTEYQDPAFNCLGLLYNSDTLHSSAAIYLTTEGALPTLHIPLIVPQTLHETHEAKSKVMCLQDNRKRAQKGDNGWTAIGDPIKTINIRNMGEKGSVERRYFIGIKRKDEKIYVRDSIAVRSGRKNNPYIAKVASIWQEADGIVLTVFWYYRPEDVPDNAATVFYPNELMASQHHDDIGVACVDDTCHVLGFTQFCRYRSNLERIKAGVPPQSIVPGCAQQDLEGVNFSEFPNSRKNHINEKKLFNKKNQDDDDLLVYFCFRAFNHFTGRIIKSMI